MREGLFLSIRLDTVLRLIAQIKISIQDILISCRVIVRREQVVMCI